MLGLLAIGLLAIGLPVLGLPVLGLLAIGLLAIGLLAIGLLAIGFLAVRMKKPHAVVGPDRLRCSGCAICCRCWCVVRQRQPCGP